ncbi:MAG TPA: HEAT repeat domain-containing protein [Gemmataceae bacterium]|nr:HEAT repeat domain-containing protein [Gemmataceae bacterium]
MFRWLLWWKSPPSYLGHAAIEWYGFYRRGRFPGNPLRLVTAALRKAFSGASRGADLDLEDPDCLGVLLATDAREGIRCLAAIKLGLAKDERYETSLLAALQDESETVRRTAAVALLDLNTVRGLAAVVGSSQHGHRVRMDAAHRLRQYGPAAAEAIPALAALLRDQESNWRSHCAAAGALAAVGEAAIPWLLQLLAVGKAGPRYYAAMALKEMNKTPEHVLAIEQELARGTNPC